MYCYSPKSPSLADSRVNLLDFSTHVNDALCNNKTFLDTQTKHLTIYSVILYKIQYNIFIKY